MSAEDTTKPDYRCSQHPAEQLRFVLRGGAGYCAKCRAYTQAAGVEMPKLDELVAAKRAEASKPKAKKAKPKKRAKAKRRARQIQPSTTQKSRRDSTINIGKSQTGRCP